LITFFIITCFKDSWTDTAIYNLLKLMEMENSDESRFKYLELLASFMETLQFKAPQFLAAIVPIMDHYIDASLMSSDLCHQILMVNFAILSKSDKFSNN